MLNHSHKDHQLSSIIKLSDDINAFWNDQAYRHKNILSLKDKIAKLKIQANDWHPSVFSICAKISTEITQKDFKNFLIPFHRELQKKKFAHQFIVEQGDKTEKKSAPTPTLYFLLENIRSALNIGSILRLAECVGAQKVLLCGYTADVNHPKVEKSAMGCHKEVITEKHEDTQKALFSLKEKKIQLFALETFLDSKNLFSLNEQKNPVCFLVGNEVHGLSLKTLSLCDDIFHIPVYGKKNSLNVSNALAIAAYQLRH